MGVALRARQFNTEEFHRMADAGILGGDDRLELIDGEIFEMTPIGPFHAECVRRLTKILVQRVGNHAEVSVHNPIQLGPQTELYPDIALLQVRQQGYRQSHPGPKDILLLIEAGDTSFETDRTTKIPRYAQAAIPEVWLIDIPGSQVHVYTEPSLNNYKNIRVLRAADALQATLLPACRLTVDEIV
jgi:Uma2 family endonuclease